LLGQVDACFRQYRGLIESSFPASLLNPDNGHRMLLPNLVRVADIEWSGGDQTIGVVLGILMMISAFVLIALPLLRFRDSSPAARASGVLLAALALFWLGSARMQFHGNESFQVYTVMCCAIGAVLLHDKHVRSRRQAPLLAALLLATLGMLTFAPGVAIFPLLIALALMRRTGLANVGLIGVTTFTVVGAYLFLLPGGEGVRNTIEFAPGEQLATTAAWLSSCWLVAWPGLGDAPVFGIAADSMTTHPATRTLALAAQMVRQSLGEVDGMRLATVIGSLGLLTLVGLSARAWLSPKRVTRMESLGIGIGLFAAAVAGLVAIGRMDYFRINPHQIFADRYVLWTCFFWLGLALALIARLPRGPLVSAAAMTGGLLLALALLPTQQIAHDWAALSVRVVEARSAQAQSGVLLAGYPVYADLPDDSAVLDSVEFYRAAGQAIFRTPRSRLMDQTLPTTLRSSMAATAPPSDLRVELLQLVGSSPSWHVQGELTEASIRQHVGGVLLVDADWRVVGLGEFSFAAPKKLFARVDRVGLGFDLYARPVADDCRDFRLFAIDDAATRLWPLSELKLCTPPPVAGASLDTGANSSNSAG